MLILLTILKPVNVVAFTLFTRKKNLYHRSEQVIFVAIQFSLENALRINLICIKLNMSYDFFQVLSIFINVSHKLTATRLSVK